MEVENIREDNDEYEKRVRIFFRSESEIDSLDSSDVMALCSLIDHLLQKTDQQFFIKCDVKMRRLVFLNICGSSGDEPQSANSAMFFFYFTQPGIYLEEYQEFRRSDMGIIDIFAPPTKDSITFSRLEDLRLHLTGTNFETISSWMTSKVLKNLTVLGIGGPGLFMAPRTNLESFLCWMTKESLPSLHALFINQLPSCRLRSVKAMANQPIAERFLSFTNNTYPIGRNRRLRFGIRKEASVENFLILLCKLDLIQNLTTLHLGMDFTLQEAHLKRLFTVILPKLRIISNLSLKFEIIPDAKRVLDNIISHRASIPANVNAQWLKLIALPYGKRPEEIMQLLRDPTGRAFALRFLKHFNTVYCIGDLTNRYGLALPPDIEYALIKNSVGRRLLENTSPKRKSARDEEMRTPIPASIWPYVLERAQSERNPYFKRPRPKGAKATGIYYLLREGPVLRERLLPKGIDQTRHGRKISKNN